jgi:hypothetical protein
MYSDNVIPEPGKYYVLGRHSLLADGRFQYSGFDVIERATDQVIKRFDTYNEALKYANTLKSGQAFDGWTPAFILQSHS